MSLIVDKQHLNKNERTQIDRELTITYTIKGGMRSFQKKLLAYDVRGNSVHMPFNYGKKWAKIPSKESVSFKFVGSLRDYQSQHVDFILDKLYKHNCYVLSLHVGWGKSIFAIYIACQLKRKTMIIVHKLILIDQWKELIEKVCPLATICIVKPSDSIKSYDFYNFLIVNVANVPKLSSDLTDKIGTLICDEMHLICALKLHKAMFSIQPEYLLGLSATPYRNDGLDPLLDLSFGSDKLIKKLFRQHTVYKIETGITIPYEMDKRGKMIWSSVIEAQSEHEERNKLIVKLAQHFSDRVFLILCKRVKHVDDLYALLKDKNEDVTKLVGKDKDFNKDARIVVATTQKCGVGFSHDRLDAMILAVDIKDYFIQFLGRVFRTPEVVPYIFDIVDNMGVLMKHYSDRKKTYIESGGQIITDHNLIDILNSM